MREIERRLTIWDASRVDEASSLLGGLEQRHRDPGSAAQSVDRLLQRLLHRLEPARTLAETCVVSDRRLRRQAAWKYFRLHGCDPAVESVLVEQLRRDPLHELVSLAVGRPDVLRQVPLAPMLARIEAFSWRVRVLEALLGGTTDADVLSVAAQWPGEVVFAIRRAGRCDLVHIETRLAAEAELCPCAAALLSRMESSSGPDATTPRRRGAWDGIQAWCRCRRSDSLAV
jgi:hypothetical protein